MKSLTWFKFSPSDWMMGRISRQSPDVQIAFLRLCCIYWNNECRMSIAHAELETDGHFPTLVKLNMVETNDDCIVIKFLDIQIQEIYSVKERLSYGGKKSAEKRWNKQPEEKPKKVKPIVTEIDTTLFDSFWTLYPKKQNKTMANKLFMRLPTDEQQLAVSNIERLYANTPVQYVPLPSTYINNKRWNDEINNQPLNQKPQDEEPYIY
jgi:hypothetical protein